VAAKDGGGGGRQAEQKAAWPRSTGQSPAAIPDALSRQIQDQAILAFRAILAVPGLRESTSFLDSAATPT
jgi:hypothetical protein